MHDPRTTTALVLATLALAGGAAWYGLADHGAEPVLQESADDDGLGDVRVITRAESLAAQEGAAAQARFDQTDDWNGRNNAALAALDAGDLATALAEIRACFEHDPANVTFRRNYVEIQARYARGLLALDRKNLELAERHFLELIEQPAQRFDAAYYLGRISEARGDLDAARGWYRRVAGGRHQVDALTRRAYLMADGGHVEEAQAYLQGLARMNPGMELQLMLVEADILLQSDRPEAALEIYEQGLVAYPAEADLLYGRSLAHEQLGQVDKAIADLREMVQLDEHDARALNALGYILTNHTERYSEARGYIARALEQRPDDPAVIDSMGWVEFRLGNLDAAAEHLRRAYELLGDPEIAAHLGEVLWKMGERDEARQVWDTALTEHPEHGTLQETITRLSP